MRILHIDTGREMRGGQWQVLYLLRGLSKRNIASRLLARGPLLEAALAEGLDASLLTNPFALSVAANGFDLTHAHDAKAHSWCAIVRKPLVVARRVAVPLGTSVGAGVALGDGEGACVAAGVGAIVDGTVLGLALAEKVCTGDEMG